MTNNLPAIQVPLSDLERMAAVIAKSGLFGVKTGDQALALMLVAQAEGLHPASAAKDYHIIQGRPCLKADSMLARFMQAGGSVAWGCYTDEKVSAKFSHPQGGTVEVDWTIARAKAAGLTGKDTWRQYPRQMLRARVVSEGIRTVFPAVCSGTYTPEEVSDFDAIPAETTKSAQKKPTAKHVEAEVVQPTPVVETAPEKTEPQGNAADIANELKQIRAMAVSLGAKSNDDIRETISNLIQRQITTSQDLSADERATAIAGLKEMASRREEPANG